MPKGRRVDDEQKKQVEELMKANQQSTDTQSNTTQSEQKATQNKGTGATKRGKQSFTVVLFSHTLTGHGFITAVSRFRLSALAFIQFSIGHG